jgi:adenylate kinase family enzyme
MAFGGIVKQRIVIIGNAGSGKSHLAKQLGSIRGLPVLDLDELFWMPGGFDEKRPPEIVCAHADERKKKESWIVEGVYGEIALHFLDRAELLIWLDLDWEICRASLYARKSERKGQSGGKKEEDSFGRLIAYAGDYWKRDDLRSHSGHRRMFDAFTGSRLHFSLRKDIEAFISKERAEPKR